MPSRSSFESAAIAMPSVSAFGGLVVGASLVYVQWSDSVSAAPIASGSVIPAGMLAYGLVSLVGAVGIWLEWRSAMLVVVVPQAIVALFMLGFYVSRAADS